MKTVSFKLPRNNAPAQNWVIDSLTAEDQPALPRPIPEEPERLTIDVPVSLQRQARQTLEAFGRCGAVLMRGAAEMSWECLGLAGDRLQMNFDGLARVARCRTAQEFAEVQSQLVRDNVRDMLENSRRVAEMSMRVADDAAQALVMRNPSWGQHHDI